MGLGLLTAVVLNMLAVPALFLHYGVDRPSGGGITAPRRSRRRCWNGWGEDS